MIIINTVQVVTLNEAKALLKVDDDLIIAVYDYWLNKRLRLVCSLYCGNHVTAVIDFFQCCDTVGLVTARASSCKKLVVGLLVVMI